MCFLWKTDSYGYSYGYSPGVAPAPIYQLFVWLFLWQCLWDCPSLPVTSYSYGYPCGYSYRVAPASKLPAISVVFLWLFLCGGGPASQLLAIPAAIPMAILMGLPQPPSYQLFLWLFPSLFLCVCPSLPVTSFSYGYSYSYSYGVAPDSQLPAIPMAVPLSQGTVSPKGYYCLLLPSPVSSWLFEALLSHSEVRKGCLRGASKAPLRHL